MFAFPFKSVPEEDTIVVSRSFIYDENCPQLQPIVGTLKFHSGHGVLICTAPKCGLLLTDAPQHHMLRNHSVKISEEQMEIVAELKNQFSEMALPEDQPIEGVLTIPGFQCGGCDYFSMSQTAVKKHCEKNHANQAIFEHKDCFIQRRRYHERKLVDPPHVSLL